VLPGGTSLKLSVQTVAVAVAVAVLVASLVGSVVGVSVATGGAVGVGTPGVAVAQLPPGVKISVMSSGPVPLTS